jgi:predicted Zn-dependent protease
MVVKDNFIKAKYTSAENRFIQSNVKASYDDFNDLIQKANHDDYVFLLYGMKMAEYGLFDLSDNLIERLDNNHFTASYVKDMKRYYYPSSMLSQKDIIGLADAYSNIVYNNMALETTSELLNIARFDESDYKNYLIALGYYKSNNLPLALKYIDNAILENDTNINYLSLKAKILADSKKNSQALKVLAKIKKTPFLTTDFKQKVRATEEYVLYRTSKADALKDYHLAYYYHLQDKSLLATKVLQSAILTAKQYSSDIYALLGRIYYENNEPLKAQEFASRAYKEDSHNYLAILTLADINFDMKKYTDSLNYYKKAKKQSKDPAPQVGIAKSYLALKKTEKAKKIYEKLLQNNKMNEDLLVESLKVIPQRVDYYLPRVASIDLANNDIWLGLANHAIKDGNYTMATTYLNNSYYIDENNFKYYYYLSLVLRAKGDNELAERSLIRCADINADYEAAVKSGYSEYYGK